MAREKEEKKEGKKRKEEGKIKIQMTSE